MNARRIQKNHSTKTSFPPNLKNKTTSVAKEIIENNNLIKISVELLFFSSPRRGGIFITVGQANRDL
ncbi:MAG: hypothetical protein LBC20_18635, partial [Planctomycetaceae bacterium]|nr:hypothetical protein [Planctomycetaceae bacterium]